MIRTIQHTDDSELFALVNKNREYLKRWLPWLDKNNSIDDTKGFIKHCLTQYSNNSGIVFVIKEQDFLCGVVGLNWIDWSNKSGGIGYWLGEKYMGKGILTRACKELEKICFNEMKLNKLEIRVAEHNEKSINLAKRLMYVESGIIRDAEWLYDHYVNHIIYSKLLREYQENG